MNTDRPVPYLVMAPMDTSGHPVNDVISTAAMEGLLSLSEELGLPLSEFLERAGVALGGIAEKKDLQSAAKVVQSFIVAEDDDTAELPVAAGNTLRHGGLSEKAYKRLLYLNRDPTRALPTREIDAELNECGYVHLYDDGEEDDRETGISQCGQRRAQQ